MLSAHTRGRFGVRVINAESDSVISFRIRIQGECSRLTLRVVFLTIGEWSGIHISIRMVRCGSGLGEYSDDGVAVSGASSGFYFC